MILACCLQKDIDEKRAAGELLDQQIASDFARRYLLSARDVFDEFCGFRRFELFETKCVEEFEVTFRVVCCFEDLATQSGQNEGKTTASEDAQYLRA